MKNILTPRMLLVLALILAVLLAITLWQRQDSGGQIVINGIAVPPVPQLDRAQIKAGEKLYGEHCAACHGADLEGQPDWRVPLEGGLYPAPPHDESGHTWHHADAVLVEIVRDGGTRDTTAMPGFGAQLSGAEIDAILSYIKSTWGKEERAFQWWATSTRE